MLCTERMAIPVPQPCTLQVPTGASHAVAPDGKVYTLKWVQDDNGHLHLQDHRLDMLTDSSGAPAY